MNVFGILSVSLRCQGVFTKKLLLEFLLPLSLSAVLIPQFDHQEVACQIPQALQSGEFGKR